GIPAALDGVRMDGVALIEKLNALNGSSSLALGTLYGAGTKLQQAAGIQDSPQGLLEYFLARGGDKLDFEIQKFCADHFGETIDWLSGELGVPFVSTVSIKGTDTVPRGHNLDSNATVALNAVEGLAQKNGVEFHFLTTASSLVTDGSNAVVGVVAKNHAGEYVEYRAGKVIMASGGFCRNAEMIDQYCPDYKGVYTEVGLGCTGEGLAMGLDIGADYIGHGGTNGILACAVSAGQSKLINTKALWVDASGKRFVNEGGQTHDIYYQVAHFPNQDFYAVYDQAMVDALDAQLRNQFDLGMEMGIFAKGDTVAAAAQALKIDGAAAEESLSAYNALVATGSDSQFGKSARLLTPITKAPFYLLTLGVCTHGSFGGYRVNTNFQALDTKGDPIANLYAIGEVSSGTFIYEDYPSGGCGLNWSYTSGRYAGAHAAGA
ncbi:MAG TPA: FAD-binding dehydrogenase, partial [Coriobacteriia bacterium]|nr:FAD-binding dehydrogenase [Coriobacteriia bacterium]